jgi:iron complex outermembrane receptor protein
MKVHNIQTRRIGRATTLLAALSLTAAAQSFAQDATGQQASAASDSELSEVVVTGSRIRRAQTDTSAPLTVVDSQDLTDRGYVSAAQAINQLTSVVPQLNQAPGSGASSGTGQQFPVLFGLGAGRTLTLVNGRRFVTSSSGLGDAQVDANIIPTGLIERVDVVQAGNAAVYGSDAIAGVVNYVLKRNFQGIEIDAQTGDSTRSDYQVNSLRATLGKNFGGDRGNISANIEWSESPELRFSDRPLTNLARITTNNAADTGPNDGIPSVREVIPAHFWNFNPSGVIFTTPAPPPNFLLRVNGVPQQVNTAGELSPYDPGTILGIPFAQGGQGYRFSNLTWLRTAVERTTANVIGHYDINDNIKLSGELLYSKTEGLENPQGQSRTVLNSAASNAGPILFNRTNPYLSAAAITTLSTASPAFAAGAPLWLSKYFLDLLPSENQETITDTYRGLVGLDGDFAMGERDYYWSLSVSYGRVEGSTLAWGVINSRFSNAISSARSGTGSIVCAINADANAANDDSACAPINPFGTNSVSQAARDYVGTRVGSEYVNKQFDALATLGGSLFTLPAGDVKFSVGYERRSESANFVPLAANQQGITGVGSRTLPQYGSYGTKELSAELLVPIVGDDFTLPLVRELELSSAFRNVDHSAAGGEDVWNLGLRWGVVDGFTLRGSRSRNFRAPTLTQLFAPVSSESSRSARQLPGLVYRESAIRTASDIPGSVREFCPCDDHHGR